MHEVFFVFGYALTVHLICWVSWYPCNFSDFIYFVPFFLLFIFFCFREAVLTASLALLLGASSEQKVCSSDKQVVNQQFLP